MTKHELLLVALAAGGQHEYTPVQIQKLLFLIEANVSDKIGGPVFHFEPYDYGPFDASIYDVLRQLNQEELVESIVTPRGWAKHVLTDTGLEAGKEKMKTLSQEVAEYIVKLSEFVRSLTFTDLVSAIYKAYPDMKVNSVFRG